MVITHCFHPPDNSLSRSLHILTQIREVWSPGIERSTGVGGHAVFCMADDRQMDASAQLARKFPVIVFAKLTWQALSPCRLSERVAEPNDSILPSGYRIGTACLWPAELEDWRELLPCSHAGSWEGYLMVATKV